MRIRILAALILATLPIFAYSQAIRHYGVDNHASIVAACTILQSEHAKNRAVLRMYNIGGPNCPNKSFTATFMTLKLSVDAYASFLKSGLFKLMFGKTYFIDSIQDRPEIVNGVPYRVDFLRLTERSDTAKKAAAMVCADNTLPGSVYVTVFLFTPNPTAMAVDRKRTLSEMNKLVNSIRINNQAVIH